MDPNAQPDPRRELCERFRADLAKPLSDRYYSEDELIEIFDYAGDVNDDYLRAEALMLGARLYPDSGELAERRAIFYLFFDERVFKAYLADHEEAHTPLWEIMRLNLLPPGTDEARSGLESFLASAGELSDEEVIQFVQLASALDLNKWLYDNVDRLRAHCTYMPTLLYELAVNAELAGFYDKSAAFLDELTEIEPYNPDYWTMLASVNLMLGKRDEASADIEYALAIDPDNTEALRAKIGTIEHPDVRGEFGGMVDKILTANPADEDIAYMAVEQGLEADDAGYANAVLARVADHIRDSYRLVEKAIVSGYTELRGMLENLYAAGKNDRDEWMGLADLAYRCGNLGAASMILQVYEQCAGEPLGHDVLLYRMLYAMRHYDVVAAMFMSADQGSSLRSAENLYIAFGLFVMSLLRLGQTADAANAAENMLTLLTNEPNVPGDVFQKYAMRTFLADVVSRCRGGEEVDWQAYDPLGLGS